MQPAPHHLTGAEKDALLDHGGKFLRLRKALRNFHLPTSQDGKTAFSAIRKMATPSSGPSFSRPTPPT